MLNFLLEVLACLRWELSAVSQLSSPMLLTALTSNMFIRWWWRRTSWTPSNGRFSAPPQVLNPSPGSQPLPQAPTRLHSKVAASEDLVEHHHFRCSSPKYQQMPPLLTHQLNRSSSSERHSIIQWCSIAVWWSRPPTAGRYDKAQGGKVNTTNLSNQIKWRSSQK